MAKDKMTDGGSNGQMAAPQASVKIKKVNPPEGLNAILGQRVKIGDEVEVLVHVAARLCRHGEFEGVSEADRTAIEAAMKSDSSQ